MSQRGIRRGLWRSLAALMGGLIGLATFPPGAPAQDAESLSSRAQSFWDLRVEGDRQGEFVYLEPRVRARLTPRDYAQKSSTIQYLGAQIEGTRVRPPWGVAKVRVLGRVIHPALRGQSLVVEQVVDDIWIWVDGQWFKAYDPPARLPD